MTYNRGTPHFPNRDYETDEARQTRLDRAVEDEVRAALATDEEIARTFQTGIHLSEPEAHVVLAALRQYEKATPSVHFSAVLKVEAWLLAQ